MRWKQFFTPIKSINTDQGRELSTARSYDELAILDVRQPSEYEAGHIPGAKLIPLPNLMERLAELDAQKTIMVY
jgi:rhodanese-related sulfurtransferase